MHIAMAIVFLLRLHVVSKRMLAGESGTWTRHVTKRSYSANADAEEGADASIYDGLAVARQAPFASRSLLRALLTRQVNPGSLYRRGRST